MALFWHISRAASSANESSWSGAKCAGCLKKEHVACNKNYDSMSSIINSNANQRDQLQKLIKNTLASSFARSCGSKLQAERKWRTMEGLADNGNSPGLSFPKQCRCCLWCGTGGGTRGTIACSFMLWY